MKFKIKNSIFSKLLLYFGISILSFSVVVGSVFGYLFIRNTVNTNKKNLETRALKIADIVSDFWYHSDKLKEEFIKNENMQNKNNENSKNFNKNKENSPIFEPKFMSKKNSKIDKNNQNNIKNDDENDKKFNRKMNMRLIEDIAMVEVWLIDAKTGEIIQGRNRFNRPLNYQKLPPNAEKIIKTALKGETSTSENFNNFLDKRAITIATPIFDKTKNTIEAVVLLHSPIENFSSAVNDGIYTIILSIIIALTFAGITSVILTLSFIKPLNKIQNTTLKIANGDYLAKTEVSQKDEIGILAKSIDELAKRLYKSSKESEHFEQMRQDFIANVSHELRTPITVIRGSIEAICDGIITEKEQIDEYHKQILADSIHLQRLVNDLIDLTKLQNPDFSIEKNSINLYEVVNDAIRSMRQLANKKNINILFKTIQNDFIFIGDYDRIRQMIIIILDNAIKFSSENKIINVIFEKVNNQYILNIIDSGKGIEKENIDKIFNRYHKTNSEENRAGIGLGLAIAHQIATRHNIKISVSSVENVETKFSFIF